MKWKLVYFCLPVLIIFSAAQAQQQDMKGWQLLDPVKDSFYGISLNSTYQLLSSKKSKPVIVAVIDSGVDTTHEDLKNILWHNPKEIPGNGIDDDGNGYVDDVYGWNFLGNKNGDNLSKDGDERTRVYYRFKSRFAGKSVNADTMNELEKEQYKTWQKAAGEMQQNSNDQTELMYVNMMLKLMRKNNKTLQTEMQKDEFTINDVEAFTPATNDGKQAKFALLTLTKLAEIDKTITNTELMKELSDEAESRQQSIDSKTTAPPDYRAQVIKDDYTNINDKYYGNADVMGGDPMHGTHVCGIIAAQRDNNLGMQGIANNVKVMMVRAVPEGDEYDKDIALAIRYAVDNGAKVINMSFGKGYSPEKNWVDEAVHYAETKDVLIVHAAGNESADVDTTDNYPNPDLIAFHTKATNFITVGASSDAHLGSAGLIAGFSNYGPQEVNVFAPGVKIYSTLPGGNKYGFLQGTSMASPVVAGVAALIRSYFPDLSAQQVKYAIEKSATQLPDSVMAATPGTNKLVPMQELCTSGGFLNAYAAVQLAATLKPDLLKQKKGEVTQKIILKNDIAVKQ